MLIGPELCEYHPNWALNDLAPFGRCGTNHMPRAEEAAGGFHRDIHPLTQEMEEGFSQLKALHYHGDSIPKDNRIASPA